jgi:phospholipase/carboxylesterase
VTSTKKPTASVLTLPTQLPVSYHLRPAASEPKELLILLHGYSQRGDKILKSIEPLLAPSVVAFAPNGPFPTPVHSDGVFKEAYSWYFYDARAERMVIGPEVAVDLLLKMLQHLKLDHLPTRILGFSQGGYFAPVLAQKIPLAHQVIGVACEFRPRYFPDVPSFRIDAVHGEADTVIPIAGAETYHRELLAKGWAGEFIKVADAPHSITAEMQAAIRGLLG